MVGTKPLQKVHFRHVTRRGTTPSSMASVRSGEPLRAHTSPDEVCAHQRTSGLGQCVQSWSCSPAGYAPSSGRTVHGDRRPAGPYGPAECMNGRRPVWHGWAGPNRAPCLLPIAPWSLHPYVSRESAADRTWLVERRLLLKVMTGPSRLMYGTTRVSKRRLNSTVDERGGARHANPRFTAVAVVGWSSSSEAHDGR